MTIELGRYNELKAKADRSRREVARAEGALSQTMSRLEKEFAVKTIKQAEELVTKLQKERNSGKRKFELALRKFEKRWGEKLEEEG